MEPRAQSPSTSTDGVEIDGDGAEIEIEITDVHETVSRKFLTRRWHVCRFSLC